MDNWSRPFFRSMLSESDGIVSSSRFCIVLVVLFSLGWVTGLVLHDRLCDAGLRFAVCDQSGRGNPRSQIPIHHQHQLAAPEANRRKTWNSELALCLGESRRV
jgi:hypothetical protein